MPQPCHLRHLIKPTVFGSSLRCLPSHFPQSISCLTASVLWGALLQDAPGQGTSAPTTRPPASIQDAAAAYASLSDSYLGPSSSQPSAGAPDTAAGAASVCCQRLEGSLHQTLAATVACTSCTMTTESCLYSQPVCISACIGSCRRVHVQMAMKLRIVKTAEQRCGERPASGTGISMCPHCHPCQSVHHHCHPATPAP